MQLKLLKILLLLIQFILLLIMKLLIVIYLFCDYKEVFKICQRPINLNINDNDLNLSFINCNIGLREYSKLISLIENYIQENSNDQSSKNFKFNLMTLLITFLKNHEVNYSLI